jgi:uncharacterized protein
LGSTPAASPRHTNRLANETSPYLLQHAHNPVDWYPWGPDALEKAKREQKPIFLSIGYAACHWCHVMERESFEDEATAAQLNEGFVPVKVDREERPDLDAVYMDAVQAMTGQGGWPMSVFLTPEGRPFYGGTYFPGDRRYGMPSFRDVLEGVSRAWREDREAVESAGSRLVDAIDSAVRTQATPPGATTSRGAALAGGQAVLETAVLGLERSFDAANGGWGGAPKFPQPMVIEFLLRQHLRTGDARPLAMARRSLDAMAAGGIYDHLGGGFARYATDARWLVPHFEKMLYDNAQLARIYVHAFQFTGDARYRAVAEQTLDFVLREMRTAEGGFASSQDADTAGEEGKTYVWSAAEIREELGADAPLFEAAYGVSETGNWEGKTILSRVKDDSTLAKEQGVGEPDVQGRLASARARLLQRRQERLQPARDDKVLAAWNGLMLAAFADASRALDRREYGDAATRAADFLLTALRTPDGRLRRSWKDGRASQAAVLEDYTHLADGLLALYETTFEERWFVAARELMDHVLAHFRDPSGSFFDTSDEHEALITRPKGLQDNALPSGNAMAALVLLRLAAFTGEARYREAAEQALDVVVGAAGRYPAAFGQWLNALDFALAPVDEIAIVGDPRSTDASALLAPVQLPYRPWQVLAATASPASSVVPLLADRHMVDGRATAYVCRNFACRQPVTDAAALVGQLAGTPPRLEGDRPGTGLTSDLSTDVSAELGRLPGPGALIFDLDGTLVATVETRIEAWLKAFEEKGIRAHRRQVAELIGADGKRLAREVAKRAGRELTDEEAEELDRRSGKIYDELNTDPRPLPGARELLMALEESNLPWAIATSSRREQVKASVDALRLPKPPAIVDGSHVEHAKPAPDLLLQTAERVATPPGECWCIGDATWDMRAAKAAEMTGIGVKTGAVDAKALRDAGAAVAISSLNELAAELRRRRLIR